MPVVSTRGILEGLLVEEAMRRKVIQLSHDVSLDKCINQLIKFKVNALLITDETRCPVGAVSKTDIVGAFYGGLPIVESLSMDIMRKDGVHQLFVQGAEPCAMVGTLSYSDVVALLYRYCRACPKGAVRRSELTDRSDETQLLIVRDAMSTSVISCRQEDSLARVIEGLTAHRPGAVLIQDAKGLPVGVISKTDIILAYHHGSSLEVEARSILQTPVASCDENSLLSDAIRHMFLKDVQRLFTYAGDPSHIVGVLSLSDAAHIRSGSCRACITSRIIAAP